MGALANSINFNHFSVLNYFGKTWAVQGAILLISVFYTTATITSFLAYALIPPGKGIAVRAGTKCMVNIVASKFFLKESGENRMKPHEWLTTVPLGLTGIMVE